MNMESLLSDNHSLSLTIWVITITILFFIMVVGMYRSIKFSITSRRNITGTIRKLLLGDMLSRLNISLTRYYRNTSDLEKERHIWACEHCPNPEECQCMIQGENINPATFCPNYHELRNL